MDAWQESLEFKGTVTPKTYNEWISTNVANWSRMFQELLMGARGEELERQEAEEIYSRPQFIPTLRSRNAKWKEQQKATGAPPQSRPRS